MKYCYRCKETKNLDCFHKDNSRIDKLSYKCKQCDKEQKVALKNKDPEKHRLKTKSLRQKYKTTIKRLAKKYYKENKPKLIEKCYFWKLKKQFNLSKSEYLELLEKQNSSCQICQVNFKERRNIHLDHCHKTGKVRALLCASCNKGLGHFRDTIEFLENAVKYLKMFNK